MSITRHQAVGAFQRWEPPSFDEPAQPLPDAAEPAVEGGYNPAQQDYDNRGETDAAAPDALATAHINLPTADEIEAIYEQARAEGQATGHAEGYQAGLEQGRAEGYQQGLEQGLQEGQQQGLQQGLEQGQAQGLQIVQEQAEQLAGVVNKLREAVTEVDQAVAEELVALAIEVARQIVHRTLAEYPDTILETVRRALQQLPQNAISIHLHPEDAALVQQHLAEQLEHGEHHIVEDAQLSRGDCVLETATSRVDATLHTRWRRVLADLGQEQVDWDDERHE